MHIKYPRIMRLWTNMYVSDSLQFRDETVMLSIDVQALHDDSYRSLPCLRHSLRLTTGLQNTGTCLVERTPGAGMRLFITSIYAYIPWIRKCFIQTVGWGTSHNYTKCTNLQCKRLKNILQKQYYKSSLRINNSSTK